MSRHIHLFPSTSQPAASSTAWAAAADPRSRSAAASISTSFCGMRYGVCCGLGNWREVTSSLYCWRATCAAGQNRGPCIEGVLLRVRGRDSLRIWAARCPAQVLECAYKNYTNSGRDSEAILGRESRDCGTFEALRSLITLQKFCSTSMRFEQCVSRL